MAVSLEELVMHDSQVVCPQCLAVCQYENNKLVARDDSDAPYRHVATVEHNTKRDSSNYCHSCGKQLPAGISFCPYCGADLAAPFDKAESAPQQPAAAPQQHPHLFRGRPTLRRRVAVREQAPGRRGGAGAETRPARPFRDWGVACLIGGGPHQCWSWKRNLRVQKCS